MERRTRSGGSGAGVRQPRENAELIRQSESAQQLSLTVIAAVGGGAALEPQLLCSWCVEGQQVLVPNHPVKEEGQHILWAARIQEARWDGRSRCRFVDEANHESARGRSGSHTTYPNRSWHVEEWRSSRQNFTQKCSGVYQPYLRPQQILLTGKPIWTNQNKYQGHSTRSTWYLIQRETFSNANVPLCCRNSIVGCLPDARFCRFSLK